MSKGYCSCTYVECHCELTASVTACGRKGLGVLVKVLLGMYMDPSRNSDGGKPVSMMPESLICISQKHN